MACRNFSVFWFLQARRILSPLSFLGGGSVKRTFLLFGCVSAVVGLSCVASAEPSPGPPVLSCTSTTFDFGATTNSMATHTFDICNKGGKSLLIGRVRTCCGASCTLTATNIPAGAAAEVRVCVDLADRRGAWRKAVYLHTNDPSHTVLAFRLYGVIPGAVRDTAPEVQTRQARIDEYPLKERLSGRSPVISTAPPN